ncbi:glycosyltransferase [Pseudomonas sp. SBB6]|uniref:glycosyltransferase n=1 Tax=Pseudomonas sp. SBB6 TaxID=2962032 RepID=UPI0020B6FD77|nr:glycosyltransferase [Pseudomonas sp. SBB6]MCP3751117.1 glycosyltransferase [Pseudomonas sp. SBB6]
MLTSNPLVSVVIPAYKSDYFEVALQSACNQTYENLEIVICDDNRSGAIAAIVERYRDSSRVPIHYIYNEQPLGEIPNAVACVEAARGKYIKTLHDDDELLPDSVATLVEVMERDPSIALASSRRLVINEKGEITPPKLPYMFPFADDVVIDGPQLVAFLARYPLNFIGEPSCMLCRREDLLAFGDQVMSLQGKLIVGFGDMAMAARLFQRGNLALLERPLTRYRVSQQQFSRVNWAQLEAGQGQKDFTRSVYELGWADPSGGVMVDVAPLQPGSLFQPVNLMKMIIDNSIRVQTALFTAHWMDGRVLGAEHRRLLAEHLQGRAQQPNIGIIVLDPDADRQALQLTLDSLDRRDSAYTPQVMVLSADPQVQAGPSPCTLMPLQPHALAAQLNQLLEQSHCDWVLLARAGEEFTAAGLTCVALELPGAAACAAVFADYATRDAKGQVSVGLRPGFNLDFLLSNPSVMAGHWLFSREALLACGGFSEGFAGAMEFELILRLVNQHGINGFGHIPEPLLFSRPPVIEANTGHLAITQHLDARGYSEAQVSAFGEGRFAIDYGHAHQPLVSIVVVANSDLAALERCLTSVLEHTQYPHYELLVVECGDAPQEVSQWLQDVEQFTPGQLRIVRAESLCTASAARNLGAEHASGELLLFFSSQSAVIEGQWLQHLLNHGLRPEVAVVGGKGFSADGKISHAGLLPGVFSGAGRVFAGDSGEASGYLGRLQLDQNYSAVTQDCLLVRAALFAEAGGFDAAAFADEGADVDLCLRLGQHGYLTVWAARCLYMNTAELAPFAGTTQRALCERWLAKLARDPACNGNVSLDDRSANMLGSLALNWRPLFSLGAPVVLAHVDQQSYSAWDRLGQPLHRHQQLATIQTAQVGNLPGAVELERFGAQVIVMHGRAEPAKLQALRSIKAYSSAARVYELDVLPESREDMQLLREMLAEVDRVVVATSMMAEVGRHLHADVRLIESRLDPEQWLLPEPAAQRPARPRVGWFGAPAEADDLASIAEVIEALSAEVDWVMYGCCPPALRAHIKELHPVVAPAQRAQALARLNLDLALAPLRASLGSEFKGPERLLEYGACGFPVVCSDMPGYRTTLPVTRVNNTPADWVQAIRAQLADRCALRQAGLQLRAAVQREWMLDQGTLDAWRSAWLGD